MLNIDQINVHCISMVTQEKIYVNGFVRRSWRSKELLKNRKLAVALYKSIPSLNKIIFIVLLSTEKISQAILNSRNIALWYSGNLEIALVLMTVNMR